jgi:hypothetical protein
VSRFIAARVGTFVSAAIGPYFQLMEVTSSKRSEGSSATVDARFGSGVSWYVAGHISLRLQADRYAVRSFDRIDAPTAHPPGFGMSFGFGFAWDAR